MLFLFLTVTDRMKSAGKVYQGSSPIESEVRPPCSLSKLLLKEESSYGWIQFKSQTWPTFCLKDYIGKIDPLCEFPFYEY